MKEAWDIYNIYCDEDYSGIDSERPEFNKLLEDAESYLSGFLKDGMIAPIADVADENNMDTAKIVVPVLDTVMNEDGTLSFETDKFSTYAIAYKEAVKKVDKAVNKGILHKNNAARKKSRYTKLLNAM